MLKRISKLREKFAASQRLKKLGYISFWFSALCWPFFAGADMLLLFQRQRWFAFFILLAVSVFFVVSCVGLLWTLREGSEARSQLVNILLADNKELAEATKEFAQAILSLLAQLRKQNGPFSGKGVFDLTELKPKSKSDNIN